MGQEKRIKLRNKIARTLNNWQQLGCLVRVGPWGRETVRRERYFWRLVSGVAKDGRAILIYPLSVESENIPFSVCSLLMEYEGRGAITGCAKNIGDAWCIVSDDEKEYKRPKRTWYYRRWYNLYKESKQDGREAE